jgi:hypothetical protein
MSRPESGGPSTSTLRWTLYVILLVVTAAALYILLSCPGHIGGVSTRDLPRRVENR